MVTFSFVDTVSRLLAGEGAAGPRNGPRAVAANSNNVYGTASTCTIRSSRDSLDYGVE